MKIIFVILLGALVLLQYRLWYGNGSIPQIRELQNVKEEQILENNSILERNRSLTAEVQDLKSGLEAIEERARTEMGMIKKGESFYEIVMPPEGTDVSIKNEKNLSQINK